MVTQVDGRISDSMTVFAGEFSTSIRTLKLSEALI